MTRWWWLVILLAVGGSIGSWQGLQGEEGARKKIRTSEPAESKTNPLYIPLVATTESYYRLFGIIVSAMTECGLHITEINIFEGRIQGSTRITPNLEDCH